MTLGEYFVSKDGKYFCERTIFGDFVVDEINNETKKIIDEFMKSNEKFYEMFKKRFQKEKISFEKSLKEYEEKVVCYL